MGDRVIVLVLSLLIVTHSDGTSTPGKYRTLFDYPADALGINDLEGQEDAPIPVTQKSSNNSSQFKGSDQLDNLRRSIPGEPDIDYPIFRTPPETEFNCQSKATGYYADVETRCQVFRVCTNTDLTGKGFAFLCPNGTLFNQEVFVCDWYQHVDCSSSENHYSKNALLNMKITSMSEMMKVVNEMMNFPLKTNGERPISIPSTPNLPRPVTKGTSIKPATFPFFSQTTPNVPRPNALRIDTPTPNVLPPKVPTFNVPASNVPTTNLPIYNVPTSNSPAPNVLTPKVPTFNVATPYTRTSNAPTSNAPTSNAPTSNAPTSNARTSNAPTSHAPTSNVPTSNARTSNAPTSNARTSNAPTSNYPTSNYPISNYPTPNALTSNAPTSNVPNQFTPVTSSAPFGSRTNSFNTPIFTQPATTIAPPTTPQQPGFGSQTFTQEGDFEINSKDVFDRTKTVQQNTYSNEPIFISSLGELSNDPKSKFDINKVTIIKPEDNQLITPSPVTKEQQLKDSLSESFRNRANKNGFNPSENNLAQGLQRVLQQNPDFKVQVLSGEADLLQFIEQILQRNPDLNPDKLNAILTTESGAILDILNDAVRKNQSGRRGESDILEKIQNILNKYKNTHGSVPTVGGEADLLDSLKRILVRSQFPIFSGEADLISFIELIVERNPEFTKQQLAAIISGEADSILSILNQKRQQNGRIPVKSGEAILLDALEIALQKYRGQPKTVPIQTTTQPQSGEGNLLENALRRIQQQSQIPIFSGEADLISFIEQIVQRNPDFTKEQLAAIISGEAESISRIFNEKRQRNNGIPVESGEAILLDAIQIILQKYRGQNIAQPQSVSKPNQPAQQIVQSGEGNLLEGALRRIQQQTQIFSGEADLISFIEQIVQRNPEFTRERLAAIISGEADLISTIVNQKKQQIPIESGEAILLEAIEIVLQKYRGQSQTSPVQTSPQPLVQSGEGNLLEGVLRRIQQQAQIAIFSGEADLVSFIEQIVQRNPDFTRERLGSIISGEADSILRIVNQKKQQVPVESGEAILLEAIEIILQKYRGQPQTTPSQTPTQPLVQSGEANLLEGALRQIQQQTLIPIFSGEADLISFIEQIVQRNPDFTRERLASIISGEADLISTIVNQKRQQVPVESGEAILLEAIEIILQKYRGQPQTSPVQTSPQPLVQSGEGNLLEGVLRRIQQQTQIPVFSGEADLVSFIEQIVQRNPDFTRERLASIISGEADLISTIVNQKKQRNNRVSVESGEAILLEAIEIILQKYRGQSQTSPVQTSPQPLVQSGEGNLLENALRRIQQQTQIVIFSGEAEIIFFIEQIIQRNSYFTRETITSIISGETDSISRIVNQKKQQVPVESGEAILLEAIEIVLQKYRGQNTAHPQSVPRPNQPAQRVGQTQTSPVQTSPKPLVQSGEGNLLEGALRRIQQQTLIPVFSGEADLISFIEQIVQRNPGFTREKLASIISGEADLISTIVNQKKQSNAGVSVESGEAILLDAIEIVLQKYRGQTQTPPTTTAVQPLVQFGEGNLLEGVLRRIQQQTQIPVFSGEADLISFIEQIVQRNPSFTRERLASIISGEADLISTIVNQKRQQVPVESGEAILLDAIEIVLQKYRGQSQTTPVQTPTQPLVQSGEGNLLEGALRRIQQQSQIPVFSGETDLITFVEQVVQRNPDFTRESLSAIISGEADSISRIVNQKKQRNNGVLIESGEAVLLDGIEIVLRKYRHQPTQPQSGEGILLEVALRNIQQQSQIPIFSGEANLISFIEQIVQQNPEFTKEQLGVIISGEADSILAALRQKAQQNNVFAVQNSEANLFEAIYRVLQKYRINTGILDQTPYKTGLLIQNQQGIVSITDKNKSPQTSQKLSTNNADKIVSQQIGTGDSFSRGFFNQNVHGNGNKQSSFKPVSATSSNEQGRGISVEINSQLPHNQVPQTLNNNFQIESGETDLLQQTFEQIALRIPNQQKPIFSGERSLIEFVNKLKQQNADLSVRQLNAINGGEANSILRNFNEKTQKSKGSGAATGSADLLESVELVLQKYRLNNQLVPPLREPIFSGEEDLLEAIQRIQQKSSIPIRFGEIDLLQFIRRIEQQNPSFTPNQLSTIINGGVDSIIQILTENRQKENYRGYDIIESGEADLLVAIQYYVETYVKPDSTPSQPVTATPQYQYTQSTQAQTTVNTSPQGNTFTAPPSSGQLTTVNSGNSFYQFSNQNQGNTANVGENAVYSFEQNKQSQFSNQQTQSTQSHITKNVFRGQDNIYTQTAISHQTRSQSTSLNSQKIHYKFTQTVPYQQPAAAPVQFVPSSVSSTKSPNAYIPPATPPPSTYSFVSTQAAKQVFTYPADTEIRRQSAGINIPTDTNNYSSISKKNDAQRTSASQALVFTEIENRPPVNYEIPHPPLQTVYPKSIQNIVESRAVNQPTVQRYSSPAIPHTLPTIVHEPTNTVATIQNVPAAFASSLNAQRYPLPVITSTYSNRESYSNANIREKVVVKVVKAPGWYLNDANERRSYFDAVARGLLSENGLVYVNNVQKENAATHSVGNVPINFTPSKVGSPVFSQIQTSSIQNPSTVYSPQNIIPSTISQSQTQSRYPYGNQQPQPYDGLNYLPPCAIASYNQHVQNPQLSLQPKAQTQAQTQAQAQAKSRQLPFNGNTASNFYSGGTSYNVNSKTVGRLPGDNSKYQYNLASLRQPPR